MTYYNHYNHIIIYNEHIFKQRAVLCIFFGERCQCSRPMIPTSETCAKDAHGGRVMKKRTRRVAVSAECFNNIKVILIINKHNIERYYNNL